MPVTEMDVVASESLRPTTANPSIEGRPALRISLNQGARCAWQESNLRNVPAGEGAVGQLSDKLPAWALVASSECLVREAARPGIGGQALDSRRARSG